MGQTKEQKILKQLNPKPKFEPKAEIATGMYLPNRSGLYKDNAIKCVTTATSGNGSCIDLRTPATTIVDSGESLSLLYVNGSNNYQGGVPGYMYNIAIDTDSDEVDTAAGLAVVNSGKSDCIYLNNRGKSDQASSPTGIGLDLNKYDRDDYTGLGLQVWDWGTDDQGDMQGPVCIYLRKHGNVNTGHALLKIKGNKNSIVLQNTDTTSTNACFVMENHSTGHNVMEIRQNGAIWTEQNCEALSYSVGGSAGASGSFTTVDGKTVTVTNGIITSIV